MSDEINLEKGNKRKNLGCAVCVCPARLLETGGDRNVRLLHIGTDVAPWFLLLLVGVLPAFTVREVFGYLNSAFDNNTPGHRLLMGCLLSSNMLQSKFPRLLFVKYNNNMLLCAVMA